MFKSRAFSIRTDPVDLVLVFIYLPFDLFADASCVFCQGRSNMLGGWALDLKFV